MTCNSEVQMHRHFHLKKKNNKKINH